MRLREIQGEERGSDVAMFEILDYLSYSQFKTGNIYTAYINTQLLLKIGLLSVVYYPAKSIWTIRILCHKWIMTRTQRL